MKMTIYSCRIIQGHYQGNELAGELFASANECIWSVRQLLVCVLMIDPKLGINTQKKKNPWSQTWIAL